MARSKAAGDVRSVRARQRRPDLRVSSDEAATATHRVSVPANFPGSSARTTTSCGRCARRSVAVACSASSTVEGRQQGQQAVEHRHGEPSDPRRQLAAQVFGAVRAGTYTWPTPVELAPAPCPRSVPRPLRPVAAPTGRSGGSVRATSACQAAVAPMWTPPVAPARLVTRGTLSGHVGGAQR
jgi:hypothetical protein